MGLGLAFRLFFKGFDRDFAARVTPLLEGKLPPEKPAALTPVPSAAARLEPKTPTRSEALTLLSALQREARLIDFIKEPIAGYEDAQIGAAVRDIHRDCGKVLDRIFALSAVVDAPEESLTDLPAGFDANRYRLVGNVAGPPPYRGKLRHKGWQATHVQLPDWSAPS